MKHLDSDKNKSAPLASDWENELRSRLEESEFHPPDCVWERVTGQINTPKNKPSFGWALPLPLARIGVSVAVLLVVLFGVLILTDQESALVPQNKDTEHHATAPVEVTQPKHNSEPVERNQPFSTQEIITQRSVSEDYPAAMQGTQAIISYQKTEVQTTRKVRTTPVKEDKQIQPTHKDLKAFKNELHQLMEQMPEQSNDKILKQDTPKDSVSEPIVLAEPSDSLKVEPAKNATVKSDLIYYEPVAEHLPKKLNWIEDDLKPKRKRWSLATLFGTGTYRDDINTSRDVSFTALKETNDGGMISFKRTRDTVTIQEQTNLSPIWSYQAGFMVSYELNKRFSVQTGAQYTLQKTNRTGEYVLRNVEQGQALAPTTIPVNDTTVYELERYDLQMPQTLHYVGVPVRLVFRMGGEKWGVTTAGGVLLNYLADAPIPSTRQVQKKGVPTIFNPWHLSGLIGIGIQYRMNNHYSVALEPNLRFSITSMTRDQVESSYPHSLGIALSLVRSL